MKMKTMTVGLALVLAGGGASRADIVSNLLQDPGFENLSGDAPNEGGTPWNDSLGNTANAHIAVRTGVSRSGTNSVAFNHYARTGYLSQKTGVQVATGQDYELSVWMRIGEKSVNSSQTAISSINMALATSVTENGSYDWIGVGQKETIPSAVGEWQQFTFLITSDLLEARVGEWLEVRFGKEYQPSEYRIFLDDASFGMVIPEPATIGLIAMVSGGLIFVRRFRIG